MVTLWHYSALGMHTGCRSGQEYGTACLAAAGWATRCWHRCLQVRSHARAWDAHLPQRWQPWLTQVLEAPSQLGPSIRVMTRLRELKWFFGGAVGQRWLAAWQWECRWGQCRQQL
jgi:hypothetical protein